MDFIDTFGSLPVSLPPYLQFALACVGSMVGFTEDTVPITTGGEIVSTEVGANLFLTAVSLWSVMLEVDNREARLLEAVVAVRQDMLQVQNVKLQISADHAHRQYF